MADVWWALIVLSCIAGTVRIMRSSNMGIPQTARTPQMIRIILTGFGMGFFRAVAGFWWG